ncbi:MAG TPA: hypothetical protein VEB59_12770 [Gemmatimonadales bacterium]|nr:hypothetical protein [Gemmatimonadales bacterium]
MIPCNRELCEECAIDVPIGLRTPAELMATIGRRLDDDFHFCEPCFRTQTGKNVPVEVTP